MIEERKDPLTGELFLPQRFNQRFANRKNQIAFNNIKARKKRHKKKSVDQALDNNREILLRILGESRSITVSKDYLLGAGFLFRNFSGIYKKDNIEYYAVYEFCISATKSGNFKIEKI